MKRLSACKRRDVNSLNLSMNVYLPVDSDPPFRLIFGLE
jgi:hypothetical protein